MTTKDQMKLAAETDLLKFIKLVAPSRILGKCHVELVRWWTRQDAKSHQMVLLPRDHQKSALVAYRVAWEITKDPTLTVLYISSTSGLAEKQLKFIKDILTCAQYRRYWPEMVNEDEGKREKWTEKEIMLDHPKRKEEGIRDSTVFTAGLTTSITGLHCNICVLDDVVVRENAYTTEGRKKVADQYSLLSSIETADAREWIVGTRYHPNDLYGTLIDVTEDVHDEQGNIVTSRRVYEVHQRQVEDIGDGTGNFLWPRTQRGDGKWFGFNTSILARKKATYLDKTQYYAQYYNNPNSPGEEAISSDNFQYYNRDHLQRRDGSWYYSGRALSVYSAIDFAFSLRDKADFTALAVIGVDYDGNIYILDLKQIKTQKIDEYYKLVYDTYMKWGYRKIRAEVTVAQEVIVEQIKEFIKKDGLPLVVDKHRPSRNEGTKEERIQNSLKGRYDARSIWHFMGGATEDLETQLMMEHPPHDDLKDALASAIDIMKIPPKRLTDAFKQRIFTHTRFGGVAA